jgi:transcriptional regulator with XRE-family HTH domain
MDLMSATMTPRTSRRTAIGRAAAETRRRLGLEIKRLRADAGLSIRQLAGAAGIDHGYLSQIERGVVEPSFAVLIAIGHVLGADLSVHLYPTTGPRIHDRVQAPIIEALFATLHPRWKRMAEVPVIRPARGFVDAMLVLLDDGVVVATEVQSEFRRLEQQLRWASDKADSLPSSSAWTMAVPTDRRPPAISLLLVIRSTRANREIARSFESTLASRYPAPAGAIHEALTTAATVWPGAGIIWATVERGEARILDRPPRGIALGR